VTARILLGAMVLAAWPCAATAHPGVHARIEAVTARLDAHPTARGFLERALLYMEHAEHVAAEQDLAAARALSPSAAERRDVLWLSARVAAARGDHALALARLDALAPRPGEAPTEPGSWWLLRSRALRALAREAESRAAMDEALAATPDLSMDVLLEAAEQREAAGEIDGALDLLDRGLVRHPDATALALEALRIEREHGRPEAALGRIHVMPERLRASPSLALEEGEVLAALGRLAPARACVARVDADLARMPPRRRRSRAIQGLAQRLDVLRAVVTPEPAEAVAPASSGGGAWGEPVVRRGSWLAGTTAALGVAGLIWRFRRRRLARAH
jgi:tetratricopeptide (TPR) repeat protein